MDLLIAKLFIACFAFITNGVGYDDMVKGEMSVKFTLKNNPPAHLYHVLPYKTFDWKSDPELELHITFPEITSEYDAIVRIFDDKHKMIYSDTKTIKTGSVSSNTLFQFKEQLMNPEELEIIINRDNKTVYKKIERVDLIKLHGTVTDFDNKPVAGAWIVTLGSPFQIVTSDANGEYTMSLPRGNYNCIAAMTNTYPTKSLENYAWNIPLQEDFKYDFKIGQAEVFRLMASAMPQNRIISGNFISWTCSAANAWMASKTTEKYEQDDSLFYSPYLPLLKKEQVKFYLDDIEITEVPLFERATVLIYKDKVFNAGYRFEFLLPKNLPLKKHHTLKVEINHSNDSKEGKAIIERGQATLHNIDIY